MTLSRVLSAESMAWVKVPLSTSAPYAPICRSPKIFSGLKIIELLQKLIRPYYKIILIVTLVIIFGLVGYYGYKK